MKTKVFDRGEEKKRERKQTIEGGKGRRVEVEEVFLGGELGENARECLDAGVSLHQLLLRELKVSVLADVLLLLLLLWLLGRRERRRRRG